MTHSLSNISLGAAPAPPTPLPPPRAAAPYDIASMSERASLLGIPYELRLHVYDYMSLWPSVDEHRNWSSVYKICRKIREEIKSHVWFEKDIAQNLNRLRAQKTRHPFTHEPMTSNEQYPFTIIPVFSPTMPCLLQGILLSLPFHLDRFPSELLQSVYELYVGHVTINLNNELENATAVQRNSQLLPYDDLKSLASTAFESHVINGKVNCNKITISIPHLFNLTCEQAENKSTDLDMDIRCGDYHIPYTLTIVQNPMEKQIQRRFFSATRFMPISNGGQDP